MAGTISANSESLGNVKQALNEACTEYKTSLNRLSNLISEITSGDIKGAPADDLRSKYESKMDTFNHLRDTIDEAEQYMEQEKNLFDSMISDLQSGMK